MNKAGRGDVTDMAMGRYFMAERGDVTNIDINFMSSWFYTDRQVFLFLFLFYFLRAGRFKYLLAVRRPKQSRYLAPLQVSMCVCVCV